MGQAQVEGKKPSSAHTDLSQVSASFRWNPSATVSCPKDIVEPIVPKGGRAPFDVGSNDWSDYKIQHFHSVASWCFPRLTRVVDTIPFDFKIAEDIRPTCGTPEEPTCISVLAPKIISAIGQAGHSAYYDLLRDHHQHLDALKAILDVSNIKADSSAVALIKRLGVERKQLEVLQKDESEVRRQASGLVERAARMETGKKERKTVRDEAANLMKTAEKAAPTTVRVNSEYEGIKQDLAAVIRQQSSLRDMRG